MDDSAHSIAKLPSASKERRRLVSIEDPLPVILRSMDSSGKAIQVITLGDSLSAGSLFLWLEQYLQPGTKIFALIRLVRPTAPTTRGPSIAVRGVVQRTTQQLDGRYGISIQFTRYRFLFSAS
jgi:hypothetical protein